MYRVLALDGGGIRGVLTAILLERLLKQVPDFLQKVDLIAGTSTGGIIALGLAKGLSPTDLRDLYEKQGEDIFDDSFLDDLKDVGKLIGADYSNRNLKRILKKTLGADTRLSQLKKRVLIPSFDMYKEKYPPGKRRWEPKFFHNYPGRNSDGNELAYKVALYTSAAPTYFPTVDGYVDGGVVANNPSMAALSQTQDKKYMKPVPRLSSIRLLSLGTGLSLNYIKGKSKDWGYAQWARPLIKIMLEGTMDVARYQCEQLLFGNFHRLAPVFPPGKIYDTDSVDKIKEIVRFAEKVSINRTVSWLQQKWI